jgi:formylglycine-generating enzyme required for sulfatase activity
LWDSVREKGDDADLQAFARLFPNSRYVEEARRQGDGGPPTERTAERAAARKAPAAIPVDAPAAAPPAPSAPPAAAAATPVPAPTPPPPASAAAAPTPPSPPPAAPAPAAPAAVAAAQPAAPPAPAPTRAREAVPEPAGKQLALAQPPAAPPPAAPAEHADANSFQDCPHCPWMVRVPAGRFVMGQGAREMESMPPHEVTLRAFALGRYPVTIGEWDACVAEKGCPARVRLMTNDPRRPVHNVSWDDARQFARWLSQKTGKHYRLPSEAEWEYAARGGTASHYWWGNVVGVAEANCADCGGPQDRRAPLPVDAFRPNGFGLFDILGGVAEWMEDCWVPNYRRTPRDGSAYEAKFCLERVLRGGSFRSPHAEITVTMRNFYDSSVRYVANGFRVARDPD